ncbi:MAG: ComEC/Rec2 family competence protein [Candidatus Zixiibacteriota bacterium]
MRRPAFYVLLVFISGILLGDALNPPLVFLFLLFTLTFLFCLLFLGKETRGATFFLVSSILLAGFLRHEIVTRDLPPGHISKFLNARSKVTIVGSIADDPDVREDRSFLTVETESILVHGKIYSASGLVVLKLKEPTFKFSYGDKIRFAGYLNEPASKRNPQAFDYKRYLNRKNIYGTVTLSKADQVEVLDKGEGNILLSKIVIPSRGWILNVLDKTLSSEHKALLAGFLLGETKDISRRVYNMFRDTGTVHLLAVSGSNVWLVIGVILGALTLLRIPRVPATLVTLVCIWMFANLTHNQAPVVRAGIMATAILVGRLLYKDIDLVNAVSFAGLLILVVSPLYLFDAGFQLSFASVFAILLLYPHLSRLTSKYLDKSHRHIWKWIVMPALISLSVEIVLFPILGYYFNLVPLITAVANVFIIPLAGLSVVLACFTVFSAMFSSFLAGVFSAANWLSLELTLKLTDFFAGLPVAKLTVPSPSVLSFVLYYLFLWLIVSFVATKRKALLFSFLLLANLVVWRQGLASTSKVLRLTFLDVSQGSSAVADLPNGEVLVINAGEKEGNFDAGEYVVVPFLNHKGITGIDELILTDSDCLNLGSAKSIVENERVEEIMSPSFLRLECPEEPTTVDRTVKRIVSLDSLQAISDEEEKLKIHFFGYPETDGSGVSVSPSVVKFAYKNVDFCLFDAMKTPLFDPRFDWNKVMNCSVLVLSELGKEEDIVKIISAVKPRRIIFTRHYFQHERNKIPVLMQLNFPGIEFHRTADHGAITCETDGEKSIFDFTIR